MDADTVISANDDYLIRLLNTMNNEQPADVFRAMHDPSHRHPRYRGTFYIVNKEKLTNFH